MLNECVFSEIFGNDLTEIEKSLQLLNPGPITSSIKYSDPYQHCGNPLLVLTQQKLLDNYLKTFEKDLIFEIFSFVKVGKELLNLHLTRPKWSRRMALLGKCALKFLSSPECLENYGVE